MYIRTLPQFLDTCEINKITGRIRKDNNEVIVTFSADHPDAYFRCKPAGGNFEDCK